MRFISTVLLAALAATPALAQMEQGQVPRPNGTMIDYSLDRPVGEARGVLLLAQGSGCLPTARNGNFAEVRAAFPGYIALNIEKYGVGPDAAIENGFTDCPAAFMAGYTVSQRVADYRAVLDALDLDLPLVLFGGSEGGLAVAMLSADVQAHAVVVLSSATGIPFEQMVLSTVPPEGQEQVKAGFAAARANPESMEIFAGSSYKFWADILDLVPADYMMRTAVPYLVIQGGRDASSPVAASRATADRFIAAAKCNLHYWEFPGLDHSMLDRHKGSHMASVAAAAAQWVANVPAAGMNC